MTRHVERNSLAEAAAAIAGYGLTAVQLTLESAGLEPIPALLDRPHGPAHRRHAARRRADRRGRVGHLQRARPGPRPAPRLPGPLCPAVRRAPLAGRLGRDHLHRHPRSAFDVGAASRERRAGGVGRACRADGQDGRPGRARRRHHGVRAGNGQRGEQPGQGAAVSWRPSIRRTWASRSIRRTSSGPPTCPACARCSETGCGAWGRR